jgi:arylsulfatase A-like enzyme
MKRIGVFLSAVLFLSCGCTNSTGQKEGNDQPNILFFLLDDLGYSDLGCYGGEVLHSAGYQTFYVGKWHMHHRTSPTKRGFDEFYGYDMGYAQDQWDQPWFLFLGHSSPHFPVQTPTETIDKYYEMYLQGWDLLREQRFDRMKETGQFENTLIMLTSDNGA